MVNAQSPMVGDLRRSIAEFPQKFTAVALGCFYSRSTQMSKCGRPAALLGSFILDTNCSKLSSLQYARYIW